MTRLLAACLLLAAIGLSGGAAHAADTTVGIGQDAERNPDGRNWIFDPETVTVNVGDTVTWNNDSQAPHTVQANDGSFNSGNVATGATYARTFEEAGTYRYICAYHEGQVGTVVVRAAAGGDDDGTDDQGGDGQGGDDDMPSELPDSGGGGLAAGAGAPWGGLAASCSLLLAAGYAAVRRRR